MLRDGELKSSKAQFRAESPKSGALPTIPKRSLNADVEQWVANGGAVTVVDRKTVVEKVGRSESTSAQLQRRLEQGERSQAAVLDAIRDLGSARPDDIAQRVGLKRGTVQEYMRRLTRAKKIRVSKKEGLIYWYEVII